MCGRAADDRSQAYPANSRTLAFLGLHAIRPPTSIYDPSRETGVLGIAKIYWNDDSHPAFRLLSKVSQTQVPMLQVDLSHFGLGTANEYSYEIPSNSLAQTNTSAATLS